MKNATDHEVTNKIDVQLEAGAPPMIVTPELPTLADALDWLRWADDDLRAETRSHGVLYLRGLPVRDVQDFGAVRDHLIQRRTPYREKATPRRSYGDDVFSSTDLPPAQPIRMHNENSYTLDFPGTLVFCCLTAPAEGGATPVADCRAVLRDMPEHLVRRMRSSGWALRRNYSDLVSLDWRTAFAADHSAQVEEYCAENLIATRWSGEHLSTSQVRAGLITHPRTGDEVWFNHLAFWNSWSLDEEIRESLVDEFGQDGLPFETSFGDGEPVTKEDLAAIDAAYVDATMRRSWQPGDVMVVDNILAAHGREPFRGDRRIVVAMGDPVSVRDCQPTVPAEARFV
ncbi:TauD/TfdA family dioxygenase [Kutzneria sp. CA-103260]|uniref:TauD/TfdA family dioxygenase n=1 Tax=Kutzneria sp. CA-103260 TaxID=2802641 RepID=UPI001BAD5159|nr:TauD/TfdA family dioxygenase [Kutzneria sp. CA-103260]QUQ67505.1 TauD/TfdA family dioxygenase [Kutzneria sp. CA-103260]